MPPGGCNEDISAAEYFEDYEPRSMTREQLENQRSQRESLRVFQETLEQVRALADQLQQQFQEASEQTKRLKEEQLRLKREMQRQQKSLARRRRLLSFDRSDKKARMLKAFFSSRDRRQAFPEWAKKYFQSIS